VPEDRQEHGLISIRSILHNMELSSLKQLSKMGFMKKDLEKQMVETYIEKLNIKATGSQQLVGGSKWWKSAEGCFIKVLSYCTRYLNLG